jgi:hypothetical protein
MSIVRPDPALSVPETSSIGYKPLNLFGNLFKSVKCKA